MLSQMRILLDIFIFVEASCYLVIATEDAKRLLVDLLENYSNFVLPVDSVDSVIKLKLGLKLSQIADIDEKNQIMTTNVWIKQEWHNEMLKWDPAKYGNISKINIPSTSVWIADVVLYNNADGDYHITSKTSVTVHFDGRIIWEPPMIYKSYCAIDIEYYPFDIQECYMKFGCWTFDGSMVNLEHINRFNQSQDELDALYQMDAQQRRINSEGALVHVKHDGLPKRLYTIERGIDMSDYYESVEWDILSVPAQKNIKYYECCPDPYYDIYFNITLRRKTLFYTVNLIIPCVNISFLCVLVFYLPSDCSEKLTLGISILVALLVFYLLLIELIPPTSIVIPLLGKYLLFTLVLVCFSILLTIFVLNLHHRNPATHKMPRWVKRLFLEVLATMLCMRRPSYVDEKKRKGTTRTGKYIHRNSMELTRTLEYRNSVMSTQKYSYPPRIQDALDGIKYLDTKMKRDDHYRKEVEEWKYMSMVIDRMLLILFTGAFLFGTLGILLQAPSIYDKRKALQKTDFNAHL